MLGNTAIWGVLERHCVKSSLPSLHNVIRFFVFFFSLKKSITNKQLLNMLVKTAHNFTAQKYRRLKVKNDGTNKQEFGIGTQLGVDQD